MVRRYAGSIAAGALVTAALIYWMQLMIASGQFRAGTNPHPIIFVPQRIELPPPKRTEPRRPPPPQQTLSAEDLVRLTRILISPPTLTAIRLPPSIPDTPPGPPRPPVQLDGRQGNWISDSEYLLLSHLSPPYPQSAIQRNMEGHVVVRFTISAEGAVREPRIVESTALL